MSFLKVREKSNIEDRASHPSCILPVCCPIADTRLRITIGYGFLGLVSTSMQILSFLPFRSSHPPSDDDFSRVRPTLTHRRAAIFISSNILGSIFQIAALPIVILAPLGAISLLWNAFFARLLLGDVFSHWMFIGTLLIATGAVLIAIFGIVPEPTHSLDDLLRLFGRHIFIVYFSLLGFAVLCVLIFVRLSFIPFFIGVATNPSFNVDPPRGVQATH